MPSTSECLKRLTGHFKGLAPRQNKPALKHAKTQGRRRVPAAAFPTSAEQQQATLTLADVLRPAQLRQLFRAVCGWAGGDSSAGICGPTQWLLFTRAAGLHLGCSSSWLEPAEARRLLMQQQANQHEGATFQAWLAACGVIGTALQPSTDPEAALTQLADWLLTLADTAAMAASCHPAGQAADAHLLALLSEQAMEYMSSSRDFKAVAAALFECYATSWELACKPDITSTSVSSSISSRAITMAAPTVQACFVPPEWGVAAAAMKQLLKDCELVPQHMTLQEAWAAACHADPRRWQRMSEGVLSAAPPEPLMFAAFIEWLGRISLIAFQVPEWQGQGQPPAAGDSQCCVPAAKALWTSQSSADAAVTAMVSSTSPEEQQHTSIEQSCVAAVWPAGSAAASSCRCPSSAVAAVLGSPLSLPEERPPFSALVRGGWGFEQQQQGQEEVATAVAEATAARTTKLLAHIQQRQQLLEQRDAAMRARQKLQRAAGQRVCDLGHRGCHQGCASCHWLSD